MKRIPRLALAVPALVCLGTGPTSAALRAIPGFSQGETIDTHDVVIPSTKERDPVDLANDPARLHPNLKADLLRIENARRAGSTTRRIFPSSWWPMNNEGIAARWNSNVKNYANWNADQKNLAPTEKYDILFYPGQNRTLSEFRLYSLEESRRPVNERGNGMLRPALTVIGPTTAWEMSNHGTYQQTAPEAWWGHCNGWASYVTSEKDNNPLRDISVRRENDKLVECSETDSGCVYFRMADIEALMSEIYFHDTATIAGRRCNTPRDKIERDAQGRPTDPACRDLNPATLHLAATGLLGQGAPPLTKLNGPVEMLPFIMDYAYHEEVWAFPIVGYEIRRAQYITEAQASRLVCRDGRQARRCRTYRWNENANRFANIEMVLFTVTYETSPAGLLEAPLARKFEPTVHVYNYILELDGRGTILGGEWINSPTVDGPNNKDLHPDFLFMSVQPEAAAEDADDRNGRVDNPYLSSIQVRELLRISRSPRPMTP